MELAGYVVPVADKKKVKPGSVLAYALSSEDISEEEAEALARYLRLRRACSQSRASVRNRAWIVWNRDGESWREWGNRAHLWLK